MGRPTLGVTTIDFTKLWTAIEEDMLRIISNPFDPANKPKYSWETLHRSVYRLCTGHCYNLNLEKFAPEVPFKCVENTAQPQLLYYLVKQSMTKYIQSRVKECEQVHGVDLLKTYLATWQQYSFGVEALNGIFLYLNREYVSQNETSLVSEDRHDLENGVYVIRKLGFLLFRRYYLEAVRIKLLETVFSLILQNREVGDNFDHSDLLNGFTESLLQIGFDQTYLYENIFERQLLNETRAVYKKKSARVESVSEYLTQALQYLQLEEKIAHRYLHPSTRSKLISVCEEVLIHDKIDLLFDALETWFENNNFKDVRNFFSVMQYSSEGKPRFKYWFQIHVARVCADRLKNKQNDWSASVDILIQCFHEFTALLENIFDRDADYLLARDNGLKSILSDTKNVSEWFARKIHTMLLGKEKLTDEEAEYQIQTILRLYTLLSDGDVFIKFYSLYLAQRLTQGKYSVNSEVNVLAKFKQLCSFGDVYKLQRMFNDMDIAENLNAQFKEQFKQDQVDFSALVLTYGSWPLFDNKERCWLPKELDVCFEQFTEFYISQHQGRKLQWIPAISKGIVKANCFSTNYELQVSSFQLSILYLFNDADKWTVENLGVASQMSSATLLSTLKTLLSGKILKSSNFASEMTDTIELNYEFSSKKMRLSLFTVSIKDQPEANEHTYNQIAEDRKYAIQASIVRLMKARKTMSYNNLVNGLLAQLTKFKPSLLDIKKNLDYLMEMEYISRHAEYPDTYVYLA